MVPRQEGHGYLGQKDLVTWVRMTWLPVPKGHGYMGHMDMLLPGRGRRVARLPGPGGHGTGRRRGRRSAPLSQTSTQRH